MSFLPLRQPHKRVLGACDIEDCSHDVDVEVHDRTFDGKGNVTALRLCEEHGQRFVRAGLAGLGCILPEVAA